MKWPRSLAEVAQRSTGGEQRFDVGVREFLDAWQGMSAEERRTATANEPELLGGIKDAYLAALAEHLMVSDRNPAPPWTEKPQRFLSEPFFGGGLEALKAVLIVESPSAFRRQLIFISADGLSRPHGAMSEREATSEF